MKEKLCYGAGGFGIQILTNTISSYYMLFLTNVMNISPLAAGQLFFRIKLIDAFTDIICASLADKVQTKYGSYRPFLMLCSFPASVFFCLNFWAPAFEAQQIRLAWAYVIYFFTSTVFATLNNVPYTALNSVMSHDRNDQSAFASARTVGENVASIIISYAVYKIILAFGTVNSPAGWRVMAVCFAILAFAALQFCAHGVQERYAAADSGGGTARSTLRNLLQLRHNTPLIGVMGIVIFFVLTNNYFETYFNYYCIYYLQHVEWTAGLSTAGALLTMLVAAAMPRLVKRLEKRYLIVFGVLCASASYLFFYFAKSYGVILTGQLLRGFGAAFIMTNVWSLLPECSLYGEWKTGTACPALVAALMLFSLKICQALANYFVGFTLDVIGFDASLALQAEHTVESIRTCVAIGPSLLSLAIIAFTLLLRAIDRKNVSRWQAATRHAPED